SILFPAAVPILLDRSSSSPQVRESFGSSTAVRRGYFSAVSSKYSSIFFISLYILSSQKRGCAVLLFLLLNYSSLLFLLNTCFLTWKCFSWSSSLLCCSVLCPYWISVFFCCFLSFLCFYLILQYFCFSSFRMLSFRFCYPLSFPQFSFLFFLLCFLFFSVAPCSVFFLLFFLCFFAASFLFFAFI